MPDTKTILGNLDLRVLPARTRQNQNRLDLDTEMRTV
jgi:hypothetical protein